MHHTVARVGGKGSGYLLQSRLDHHLIYLRIGQTLCNNGETKVWLLKELHTIHYKQQRHKIVPNLFRKSNNKSESLKVDFTKC